jgi:hypothetical protein
VRYFKDYLKFLHTSTIIAASLWTQGIQTESSQPAQFGSLNILLNYASAQTHNPYQQSKQPDMLADFAGLAGFHINRTTRRKDDGLAVLFDKKRSKPGHFCRRVKK